MDTYRQTDYHISIHQEYVHALLRDLAAAGAISLSNAGQDLPTEAESASQRDHEAAESRAADEKFRQFKKDAAALNPGSWKDA